MATATVQFFYFMPHGAIEIFRMHTSTDHLRALADLIAHTVGGKYPTDTPNLPKPPPEKPVQ